MYYSAGVGSLTSFAAAAQMPHTGVFWLAARILLTAAGGLFALYLVAMVALVVAGHAMRLAGRGQSA